jgi:hypothetical protein
MECPFAIDAVRSPNAQYCGQFLALDLMPGFLVRFEQVFNKSAWGEANVQRDHAV